MTASDTALRSTADEPYDDFLNLSSQDFLTHRVIAFVGRSGSGKSTAMRFLLRNHPHLNRREYQWVQGPDMDLRLIGGGDILVADDLVSVRNYRSILPLLTRYRTLLLASHLHAWWHHLLRPAFRTAVFSTDESRAKIARYLSSLGVKATAESIEMFARRFGATYTDVNIILERYPGHDFDRSLALFLRFCDLRTD